MAGRKEMAMGRRAAGDEFEQVESEIEEVLVALRSLDESDVEGHTVPWSDERLKRAIERAEDAIVALGKLERGKGREADVEAHARRWSDENLQQAFERVEDAVAAMRELDREGQAAEVEAHGRRRWRASLKQAIAMLTEALEALNATGPPPRLA
jgi:hypothetical protein